MRRRRSICRYRPVTRPGSRIAQLHRLVFTDAGDRSMRQVHVMCGGPGDSGGLDRRIQNAPIEFHDGPTVVPGLIVRDDLSRNRELRSIGRISDRPFFRTSARPSKELADGGVEILMPVTEKVSGPLVFAILISICQPQILVGISIHGVPVVDHVDSAAVIVSEPAVVVRPFTGVGIDRCGICVDGERRPAKRRLSELLNEHEMRRRHQADVNQLDLRPVHRDKDQHVQRAGCRKRSEWLRRDREPHSAGE